MQANNLFEYAVIRVVPQVEREEFLNVGVILYCPKMKFLQCLCAVDEERLCSFSSKVDITDLKGHLHSFGEICRGSKNGGPIAQLDMPSRFRWLPAHRDTVETTT